MTSIGQMETISISNLKTHLSSTLKKIKTGSRFIVMDREYPVAEIIPYKPITKLKIKVASQKFNPKLQLKIQLKIDPLKYLLEDRNKEFEYIS